MPTARCFRLFAWPLLIALSLLLSGCLALSEKPLSEPNQHAVDPALIGAWQLADQDGGTVTVHIGKENSLYCQPCAHALVYIEQRGDGRLSGDSYQGFVSTVGQYHYLNLRYRDADRIIEGYVFIRYALQGPDRLEVRIVDPEKLAKVVESKRLSGQLSPDGPGPAVLLTDASTTLAAFFGSSAADAVLGPAQSFLRLKPSASP